MDNYSDIPYDVDFGMLDGFISTLSSIGFVLFSVFAFVLAVYISFVTAFDLLYINFPSIQYFASKRNLDGSIDESKLKIRIISRDAYKAVLEKESSDTYKNVNVIYIRKRVFAYIRIAIILTILIAGPRLILPLADVLLRPLLETLGIMK